MDWLNEFAKEIRVDSGAPGFIGKSPGGSGAFLKYNSNHGYVNHEAPDNEIAQAFSHFTYDFSCLDDFYIYIYTCFYKCMYTYTNMFSYIYIYDCSSHLGLRRKPNSPRSWQAHGPGLAGCLRRPGSAVPPAPHHDGSPGRLPGQVFRAW